MTAELTRRHFLRAGIPLATILASGGCGTVLHPERRGQAAGPLDWKIVALDAAGLFFFFVPGVVAFAVDFSNGTIYMPPTQYGDNAELPPREELVSIHVPKQRLTRTDLEQAVSGYLNRDVQLAPGQYHSRQLDSVDDFWPTHRTLAGAEDSGRSTLSRV